MKRKYTILGIIFFLIFVNFSSCLGANTNLNDKFFYTLGKVEASCNPKAYNKNEDAIGIYQIREKYFIDAQSFDKNLIKYTHKDCFNPEISRLVVTAYLTRYCKNGSMSDMARCHNGGPNWKKKKELTDKYWNKFKRNL